MRADLVCEGGGVKGIGLAGAAVALAEAGYSFPRVAGSSAGAITTALVAALQKAGEPVSRLADIVATVDYRKFRDESRLGKIPLVGRGIALLAQDGLYEGKYLLDFMTGALKDLGVETFGDLWLPDEPGMAAPVGRNSALVVTASDLSRRRLVRLPWDLPAYGLDPQDFNVARAVRASAAIPFFFQPVRVQGATWVDGGLLSNFPVGLFDRSDTADPRWPTFGVRLVSRPGEVVTRPVRGPLAIGLASLDVLLTDQGNAYISEPCTVERTIFVPTDGVSVVDFDLSRETSDRLAASGRTAATEFLATWDWDAYRERCR